MSESPASNILIGRICGAYGIRGWVRIHSYTRPRENIFAYDPWSLTGRGEAVTVRLAEARPHGKGLVARFQGYDDRDAVIPLMNRNIEIPRSQLPDPDPGEYYWSDLVGLRVHNRAGDQLGRVHGLLETGASDVLQIQGEEGVSYLIPFVQGVYVDTLDLRAGTMQVDWDRDDTA